MEPSQRLATALLYGIKTDTLFLERGSNLADLSAFYVPLSVCQQGDDHADRAAGLAA